MISAIVFDDEIKIWWEYHRLEKGESFRVEKDGEFFYTTKSHYNFKGLAPLTECSFEVYRVSAEGEKIEKIGVRTSVTRAAKRDLNATLPPYNAVGDGETDNTAALQAAINDCKENERVYLPAGVYLSGALNLKSHVELYLEEGAVLQGSTRAEDYLPMVKSRFEGCEEWCYRSLLNAGEMDSAGGCNCDDITIRGGKILGGGNLLRKNIIARERAEILKAHGMENDPSPPTYYGNILPGRRRGRLLCCANTRNITVANTVIGNAASWNLHFIYCENVCTCGCEIVSNGISNGDGWDPDSSRVCLLFDTIFDTGDDCVAIKSGKNLEGYEIGRPSEIIRIFDCYAKEGHGIAVGSEMSGGVRDVIIWNCDIRYGTGLSVKTHESRGGFIDGLQLYNCNMATLFIGVYRGNAGGDPAPVEPTISNLHFEDITVRGLVHCTGNIERIVTEPAVSISGFSAENPVKNVCIKNLTMQYRQLIPYQMLYFDHVEGLSLENIVCKGQL